MELSAKRCILVYIICNNATLCGLRVMRPIRRESLFEITKQRNIIDIMMMRM